MNKNSDDNAKGLDTKYKNHYPPPQHNHTPIQGNISDNLPPSLRATKHVTEVLKQVSPEIPRSEDSEEASLQAAQQERSQFPIEFIDKLINVLKKCGTDGLLGSQFPEAYKKLYGEKLVLENKKGRKLKLIHVLDGHPNVRKEKLGTYKWYYKELSSIPPGLVGGPPGLGLGVKTKEIKPVKPAKAVKNQAPPPAVYSGPPGLESDLLPADSFPCVAWLRDLDMDMYRWAGNAKEWTGIYIENV